MKVWLNGNVIDGGEAVISVYDHGFLYGLGLFETFRTYEGEPYLLQKHLNRLLAGCTELGIPFVMDAGELRERVQELLVANGLKDGYIRLTVSAGSGELGLPQGDYSRPTVLLLAKALPAVNEDALRRGKELRLLHTRRNSPEGAVRFKSLHYMNNIIAKREMLGLMPSAARDLVSGEQDADHGDAAGVNPSASRLPSPGAEGLMLSREDWLAEGIVSNLFFLRGGIVRTPAIETGILPGVTRARVLELAREAGYAVEEGLYSWEELLDAEEVWLTNSIQELVPVTKLTDWAGLNREIGLGVAGSVTIRLMEMYRADTTSATI
ncbi:aminotransferase class IV [Paenibacillus sp. strain BS8-2]